MAAGADSLTPELPQTCASLGQLSARLNLGYIYGGQTIEEGPYFYVFFQTCFPLAKWDEFIDKIVKYEVEGGLPISYVAQGFFTAI